MIETEFTISVQHPSLQGHFPGNPVVPGVVILDEVIACIKQIQPGLRVASIPSVKFLAQLLPEMTVKLTVLEKPGGVMSFNCHVTETLICSGQIRQSIVE